MTTDVDVAVLGGGAAGLTAAGFSAHMGASTVLVERHRMGGDCTWTGCIPSKALLHAAKTAEAVRGAGRFGIRADGVRVDFQQVMRRVRAVRQQVYQEADTPERYENMGVTVLQGSARFEDAHTLLIEHAEETRRVRARFVIVATGASPHVPAIEGLEEVAYLTNETIFDLDEQPSHLLIVGAGRTGVEMAQAFRRLGSGVTLVEMSDRILADQPAEAVAIVQRRLREEGVRVELGAEVRHVHAGNSGVTLRLSNGSDVSGDALLMATGRRPNLESLDLNAADIAHDRNGIRVDDRCRTSAKHVYAAGDVTGRAGFTHVAEHMAKTVVMNAVLRIPRRLDTAHFSYVTYTDPEIAHIGTKHSDLEERGTRFERHRFPYDRLDRAVTEAATEGFVEIYAKPWSGKILGATLVGARAGDLISEIAVAMRNGVSVRRLSDTIHPYPTYGQGVRRAADQWYVRRRSLRRLRLLKRIFGYRGPEIGLGPDDVV